MRLHLKLTSTGVPQYPVNLWHHKDCATVLGDNLCCVEPLGEGCAKPLTANEEYTPGTRV